MDDVVMITRAGRASILDVHVHRLEQTARLRSIRRASAPGPSEAAELLRDSTILAATNVCLPALDPPLLDACPRLRAVVLYATGYDHVDIDLLARRRIALRTLPRYATTAVAEHALALMLSLSTRTVLANDRARGDAPDGVSLRGVELAGRTLGIIGTGRIGSRLGVVATGIGMNVLGTDLDPQARAAAAALGIEPVPLPDLIARSDVLAVCASTPPRATAILGARELDELRAGAFVVNVGRPALVDTGAAVERLRSGHLRGYAVDDVVVDPVTHADVLRQGRLVQTAHSAWWRDEVLRRGAKMFGEAILATTSARGPELVGDTAGRFSA